LRDPDGVVRQEKSATDVIVADGYIDSPWTDSQSLDKEGTWVIYGRLEEA